MFKPRIEFRAEEVKHSRSPKDGFQFNIAPILLIRGPVQSVSVLLMNYKMNLKRTFIARMS